MHVDGRGKGDVRDCLAAANEGAIFHAHSLRGKQTLDKGKSITMASLPGDSCSLDTRLRFMATAFTLC